MTLMQVKQAIRLLSLGQLRKLEEWLNELIRKAEESDRAEKSEPRRQTVPEQTLDNKTYQLERIRCGKENCKCTRGKLHGPYWLTGIAIPESKTKSHPNTSVRACQRMLKRNRRVQSRSDFMN
jgi:hypothetical protein